MIKAAHKHLEHLQHEIITFLLSKIHLFDPSRGAKAYSYFGTIVKRWLILYNTKNYNKKVKKVDVDVLTGENSTHTYSQGDEIIKSENWKNTCVFLKLGGVAPMIADPPPLKLHQ